MGAASAIRFGPMRQAIWVLGGLFFVSLATSVASAQPRGVQTRWAERSLTMPGRTLRLDLAPPDFAMLDSGALGEGYGFRIAGHDDDDDDDTDQLVITSGVGLAYGITSSVELGGKLLPLRFAPDPDYLDLELYLRWAFVRSRAADVGMQFVLQLPTDNPRLFGMGFGIPVRIRMGEVGRLDFGVDFELLIADLDDDGEVEARGNVDLPFALSFSVTERFHLGGQFGLLVWDFDRVALRGGGHIGYTVGRRSPLIDFTGAFNFYGGRNRIVARDGRYYRGGPRFWELMFGMRFYFAV